MEMRYPMNHNSGYRCADIVFDCAPPSGVHSNTVLHLVEYIEILHPVEYGETLCFTGWSTGKHCASLDGVQ